MTEGLFLEALSVGQTWKTPGRTITETDVVQFAGLTGDFDPLHMDHEFAAQSPYGRPIAHGLLGMSYLAGLSSTYPRVRTLAFVGIEQWQFRHPIYLGDTVYAESTVEQIIPKGRRTGQVVWLRRLINQRDQVVQEGRFTTLVEREEHARRMADLSSHV
jgi:3-hydroxybutyryl-CoA dehydratase